MVAGAPLVKQVEIPYHEDLPESKRENKKVSNILNMNKNQEDK